MTLRPDEKAQRWLLGISASDRAGLLYLVARVLARHQPERNWPRSAPWASAWKTPSSFQGAELQNNQRQIEIETEVLEAPALMRRDGAETFVHTIFTRCVYAIKKGPGADAKPT